jgi:hypothetical protein
MVPKVTRTNSNNPLFTHNSCFHHNLRVTQPLERVSYNVAFSAMSLTILLPRCAFTRTRRTAISKARPSVNGDLPRIVRPARRCSQASAWTPLR